MSRKNLKTGRKEAFDAWITSIIDDLNLRSRDFYDVKDLNSQLKPWDWKRLWQIFDEDIDTDRFELGRTVILEAYGKSDTDLFFEELMDHYLTGRGYNRDT